MEDQTLEERKKNKPIASLHGGQTLWKRKQEEKKKEKEEEKKTYSLPSLRERSETPGALDRRALGITGGEPVAQLPTFGFGPHYRLPAF